MWRAVVESTRPRQKKTALFSQVFWLKARSAWFVEARKSCDKHWTGKMNSPMDGTIFWRSPTMSLCIKMVDIPGKFGLCGPWSPTREFSDTKRLTPQPRCRHGERVEICRCHEVTGMGSTLGWDEESAQHHPIYSGFTHWKRISFLYVYQKSIKSPTSVVTVVKPKDSEDFLWLPGRTHLADLTMTRWRSLLDGSKLNLKVIRMGPYGFKFEFTPLAAKLLVAPYL